MKSTQSAPERAILVGLETIAPGHARSRESRDCVPFSAEESLEELAALTRSAGAGIAGTVLQTRNRPVAATLVGSGKVGELKRFGAKTQANIL